MLVRILGLVTILSLSFILPVEASVRDDIGYTRLSSELGPSLPTGAGVRVGLVEANTDANLDITGVPLDHRYNYLPEMNHPEYPAGQVTFYQQSTPGDISPHATQVAKRFFGDQTSIAPGISEVDVYLADTWIREDYLNTFTTSLPKATDTRVFNHSWVGQGSAKYLARVDYTSETYDVINVVGLNNQNGFGPQPLLSGAYNTISVGVSSGAHESAIAAPLPSPGLGIYDQTQRTKPDLVVPEQFTSYATPYVSGAAALLVELGHTNTALSLGSRNLPEAGYTVQNAETSEVVKSVLMAGANRNFVADYGEGSRATPNGLDSQYGAGQLDIYNSYYIMAAGEQDSLQEGGAATVDAYGFDYASDFATGDVADYVFTTASDVESLAVSLVWNAKVDLSSADDLSIQYAAEVANFDLAIYQIDNTGTTLVSNSASESDNTENIWLPSLVPETEYLLQVTRSDSLGLFDYGLSWRRDLLSSVANADINVPEPATCMLTCWAIFSLVVYRRWNQKR